MTIASVASDENTTRIPVELPDKSIVWIEVVQSGRQDVAFTALPFSTVTDTIQEIASTIGKAITKIGPTKATVKYGIEIGIEQGSLVAAIVRGTGKANLEITLEWEAPKPQSQSQA
jgi:Trypsin-co-occurring domain 1